MQEIVTLIIIIAPYLDREVDFNRYNSWLTFDTPYDLASIMHYGKTGGGKPAPWFSSQKKLQTIHVKGNHNGDDLIGEWKTLSFLMLSD